MRTDPQSSPHAWRRRAGSLAAAALVLTGPLVAVATSASAAPVTPASIGIVPSDRASVLQAYQGTWIPAMRAPVGWTGSVATCTAGTDTAASRTQTLAAVNFARGLVGRRPVKMDATLSARALRAALIVQASGTLDHNPPSTSPCWTKAGAAASGKSDLYGVSPGTITAGTPIEAYLRDDGDGNSFAGHRRSILSAVQTTIGTGTTSGANALYVGDQGSYRPQPAGSAVAAWPSAGYFPASLEPGGRWSVSIPKADFSAATVTVKKGATLLATSVTSRTDNGYGDNTLVWSVDPHYDISQGDRTFTVTVAGYQLGGVAKTTTYKTTLFDATVGMPGRNVISFPWPTPKRVGVTFDPGATDNNGLTVYYFSNTPDVCTATQNPNVVTTLAPGTCSILAFVPEDSRFPERPTETRTFTVTR